MSVLSKKDFGTTIDVEKVGSLDVINNTTNFADFNDKIDTDKYGETKEKVEPETCCVDDHWSEYWNWVVHWSFKSVNDFWKFIIIYRVLNSWACFLWCGR